MEPRELLLYAIPLIKDRLVFLPVTAWQVDPEVEKQGAAQAFEEGIQGCSRMGEAAGAGLPSSAGRCLGVGGFSVGWNRQRR